MNKKEAGVGPFFLKKVDQEPSVINLDFSKIKKLKKVCSDV